MPLAAAVEADAVSSDRWAQASKPVIVYCVSRKPNGTTANQKPSSRCCRRVAGVVEPLGEDVAERLVLVGHEDQDQHDAEAPTTCHHTETLFMIAIRWLLKMFSTEITTRTARKMKKTRVSE
jgi:hypothetical protein